MKEKLTLTLNMLSDWHVGSGGGIQGGVDAVVLLDHEDFPFVPGKTLTGIIRDSCETAALALDDGSVGRWCDLVTFLFGRQANDNTPGERTSKAAVSIRPARFSDGFRTALAGKNALKRAIVFVKPGVEIDAASGLAKEKQLRFMEVARMGAVLRSSVTLELPDGTADDVRQACLALIWAGTKLADRIGGKRRRGTGRVAISIDDKYTGLLQHLQKTNPPQVDVVNGVAVDEYEDISEDAGWEVVNLTLEVLSPIVAQKQKVGNVLESTDYIPGTSLLPVLHKELKQKIPNIGGAIVRGDLVVTNATPLIGGVRGLPVPLAFFKEKEAAKDSYKAYNRTKQGCGHSPLKGLREGYVTFGDNGMCLTAGGLGLRTHSTINDEKQRPTEEVGGVFSYQHIPAGHVLQSQLRVKKGVSRGCGEDWWRHLDGLECSLATSRKDDYGWARIKCAKAEPCAGGTNDTLTVWLLSDVLIRDERLRPSSSLDDLKTALEKALENGSDNPKLEIPKSDGKTLNYISRPKRTESWQSSWNLPRPSLAGLGAGSCVVFSVLSGKVDPKRLRELEISGIGERRAEGYGQILFNSPLLARDEVDVSQKKADLTPGSSSTKLTKEEQDYIGLIETAAWRAEIKRRALAFAADPTKVKNKLGFTAKKPGSSQLGALSDILVCLKSDEDRRHVLEWLSRIKNVESRKDKWSGSLDKIQGLLKDDDEVWRILGFDGAQTDSLPPVQIGELCTEGNAKTLKSILWAEATRSLLDACIRSIKRASEQIERPTEHETTRNEGVSTKEEDQ